MNKLIVAVVAVFFAFGFLLCAVDCCEDDGCGASSQCVAHCVCHNLAMPADLSVNVVPCVVNPMSPSKHRPSVPLFVASIFNPPKA